MPRSKYPKEVIWSAQYIMSVVGRKKLITEERISVMRGDEEITFGSMDAYCKGHLFDLKTGQKRDYKQQMAAYALGVMQKYKEKKLTCHLVYSRFKEVQKFDLTKEEAEDIVYAIVDSVNDPTRSPWPCEYCAWCDRKESCTALKHFAYTIGGQMAAMKHINLNAPLQPAVRQRLLSIVDAVENWSEGIREKVNKE
jgi:CRISPR/Cas system-associated exonuclease Cas4 (RecB family)